MFAYLSLGQALLHNGEALLAGDRIDVLVTFHRRLVGENPLVERRAPVLGDRRERLQVDFYAQLL